MTDKKINLIYLMRSLFVMSRAAGVGGRWLLFVDAARRLELDPTFTAFERNYLTTTAAKWGQYFIENPSECE